MNGRAVTLVIGIQDGRYLFGTGGAPEPIAAICAAAADGGLFAEVPPLGGPFAGPEPGDIGDWITCCCPAPINNYDCGYLPVCEFCADGRPGPGYTNEPCLNACNAIDGGGVFGCDATCTLQG